jgi:hypothetical protein
VSSHAKAPSAGFIDGSGESRRPLHCALLGSAGSNVINGSGAHARLSLPFVGILIVLFALFAGTTSAHAATNYLSAGVFGETQLQGTGHNNSPRIAVDSLTGTVVATAPEAGNAFIFDSSGSFLKQIDGTFYGVAIDQSNGDLYLADAANNRIDRYTRTGGISPFYVIDNTYSSPVQGPESESGQVGSFASAIALDPTNGDLLLADTGNLHISRFESDGDFIDTFNGEGSEGGAFTKLEDLTIDSTGDIYVVQNGAPFFNGGLIIGAKVARFEADGSGGKLLTGAPNLDEARAIVADTALGNVVVATGGGFAEATPLALRVFSADKLTSSSLFPNGRSVTAGLAINQNSGRLYSATAKTPHSGSGGVQFFDPVTIPDVVLEAPSEIIAFSARFSGTVNPLNIATKFHFEYRKVGTGIWSSSPEEEIPGGASPGEAPVPVFTTVPLEPFSNYEVRLLAGNSNGDNLTSSITFTTLASAPGVVTGEASNRTDTSAILHGEANPFGLQTEYHFEYGTTANYGSQSPLDHDVVLGKGQAPVVASQQLFGLQPATTYHYRLVARNSAGSNAGEDQTFTTLPLTAVPRRFYELVSPAEKGGNNVKAELAFQASADGNAFSFLGTTVLGGLSESAPFLPRYASRRSAADWSTAPTDPAQIPGPNQPLRLTFGISDDGTKALGLSLKKLAPGAVEGDVNVYLHDLLSGTYTTIGSTPEVWWMIPETGPGGGGMFVQGTPNFDHILFKAVPPLLPGAPYEALYDFTGGQLHLVSRAPDGTPIAGRANTEHGRNAISADGSRIVFESTETGGIYYRSGGTTRAISESRRSSDPPGTLMPATLIGGDRDLKHIYFFSKDLTDSSDPGLRSLYRYEVESDELEFLTWVDDQKSAESPSPAVSLQVSDDGSGVYFTSSMALTPDAVAGAPNTYVLRNGDLSLVLSSDGFDLPGTGISRWWASPNGRYFAFRSATQNLTGYDAKNPACGGSGTNEYGACAQIYRYDTETDEIVCASCRPDGKMPVASAYLGPLFADVGTHSFLRAVNDRGQVFFGSPEQLVPEDTNSYTDVYEYNDDSGPRLISDGSGTGSQIAEVSASGNDVFFTTKDRLVGIDTDKATDVYDARVDGGLASQNPPPAREECIRDDCKAVPNGGPELPFGGSEALSGPQNVSEAPRKRCGKGRHARKVKGKQRCVKQKKAGKQNRANNNRRQGR